MNWIINFKCQHMKPHFVLFVTCALLTDCNNNKAQETKASDNYPQSDVAANVKRTQTSGDGITGFWKLKLEAYDDNGNKILDETERKKGFKNNYSFRFNPDGSCMIVESYKGHYEVKTAGGNKMLYVYRNRVVGQEKDDPVPDVYRIISMGKDELVLLEDLGNLTFWVFERIN